MRDGRTGVLVVRGVRLAREEQVQRRQTRATLHEARHFVRQHGAQPVAEKRKRLRTWFIINPPPSALPFQQRESGHFGRKREKGFVHVHIPTSSRAIFSTGVGLSGGWADFRD